MLQDRQPLRRRGQAPLSLVVSQTTVPRGLSITASKQPTMARVPLSPWEQHHRLNRYTLNQILV